MPGARGLARNAKTPTECWKLFVSEEMLDNITHYTNIQIAKVRPNFIRERDAADTKVSEIKAVIGILYMAGVLKVSHLNISDLYVKDFTSVEFFRTTMAERRLRFLLMCLRFDDINTRNECRQTEKLAPIREFFEEFNNN